MKKKLLLVITPFLLASCAIKLPFGPNSTNSSNEQSISSLDESSVTTSESSSSKTTSSSITTSSSSSSATKTSSATTSSSTKTSSSNTTSSIKPSSSTTTSKTSSTSDDDEEEYDRPMLDCGWYAMPLPKNHDNPEELVTTLSDGGNHFSNNTFENEELPDGFRYAYTNSYDDGPSGKRASPNFYSEQDGGGLKLARAGLGFQTKQFSHTGAKLEVRFKYRIFQASGTPDTSKDTAKIYGFDKNGDPIGSYIIEKGTFKYATSMTEYKFYWTENAINLAYLEFRLLARPYKSGQQYNLEIQTFDYTSWERA